MRTRTWLSCALTAALVVGCSPDPAPRSVEQPTEEPADPQEPEQPEVEEPEPLEDVAGTIDEVVVSDVSGEGSGLYPDGSDGDAGVAIEADAVDAAVTAAVAWMDAHLTDVQSGGPGQVIDAGVTGDPALVSGGLAGPDHPVTAATYSVTVGARGAPEWLRVATVVERADGTMTATFVFLPDGDGGVSLLAVQVGDGDPAPAPAEPAETPHADEPEDDA